MTRLDMDTIQILTRLADIQAKVADLNGEAESLKAELRSLPPGDHDINGRPALRIIPTRRFDSAKAAGLLSPSQRQDALVVSYDATKVKAHLTPTEVEEFMVDAGKSKIVLL